MIQLQQSNQVSASPPAGGIQIVQQIVTPTGEIQQIPVSNSPLNNNGFAFNCTMYN